MTTRWLFVGLVVMSAIYAQTVTFPYVYEDANWNTELVGENQRQSLIGLYEVPSRTLTMHSFVLTFELFGIEPWSYHAGNVLIFALLGVAVWWLARALVPESSAVLAAIVIWWHPLASQSVSYVSARTELLLALFVVLACGALLRGGWWWAIVPACVLGALTSKESGVIVVPLLAWTWIVWKGWSRALVALAVAGFAGVVWQGERFWPFLASVPSVVEHAAVQATGFWRLMRLTVLPVGLSIDPDPWAVSSAWRMVGLVAFLQVGLVALIGVRRWPLLAWGIGWAVLSVAPRLIVVSPGEPLHEHQFLIALVGLVLIAGHLLASVLPQKVSPSYA